MTGGMTVYNSDIQLEKCRFENFRSEDALNIISSTFGLSACSFSKANSDAFDGDFVQGEITDCNFTEISGDGVDFSGSHVSIRDCLFNKISDKAISVGEGSEAKVVNCSIDTVSFGVVSKDSSITEVLPGTEVRNAKTAAFAAFQKKRAFGPALLRIQNPSIDSCKRDFWIQYQSSGWLNDSPLPAHRFDTSLLYQKP